MGFANEKDHPEVAPSQFEMNYSYSEVNIAADQVLLYKLLCRQVAARLDMTASFLPKPVTGVNGNGMHTNLSIAQKGKNLFFDAKGQDTLSKIGLAVHRPHPRERPGDLPRLQPERQRVSPARSALRGAEPDQGVGGQPRRDGPHSRSATRSRCASRSARSRPTPNPYLALYLALRTGLEGPKGEPNGDAKRERTKFLPDNIYDAIRLFKGSKLMSDLLGDEVHQRYVDLKQMQADRCPKALGSGSRLRGAVPPRGDEPVPLESILGRM